MLSDFRCSDKQTHGFVGAQGMPIPIAARASATNLIPWWNCVPTTEIVVDVLQLPPRRERVEMILYRPVILALRIKSVVPPAFKLGGIGIAISLSWARRQSPEV